MTTPALVTASFMATALIAGAAVIDREVAQDTFADTRAVIEFQRAADAYAFLHRQVERQIGLAHRRAGEAEDVVVAAELATGIIAERAKRPESVLFTPAVVTAFRHLAAKAVHAPGCDPGELRSGVWEMSHQINSPATGTRPVNACIAAALPALPDELEYRSAGTVLLLVDSHANLVVDALPALLAGSEIRR
jgi:hypothetical protein